MCRCDKYCISGPFWPLCNTFVQSANVDRMDYRIAVGFVLCSESQQRLKLSCGWCCILIVRDGPPPKACSQTDKTDERREVEEPHRSEVICLRSHSRSVMEPRIRSLATSCQHDVHCLKLCTELLWGWNAQSSGGLLPAAECSCAVERQLLLPAREHCAWPWQGLSTRHWSGSLCGHPGTGSSLIWQPWGAGTSWCRTGAVCTRNVLQVITTDQCLPTVKCDELSPSPSSRLTVFYCLTESLVLFLFIASYSWCKGYLPFAQGLQRSHENLKYVCLRQSFKSLQ